MSSDQDGSHTGVKTHRQDARQLATARARRSCHETRALRDKVLASTEGATRRPTHLRFHTSLRRHQDAAWTAHVTAAYRTARRRHTGGARVDVCRWPQHPAYGTTNKPQQRVSILHTSAHTKHENTPLVEARLWRKTWRAHTSWTQSKVQLCCQKHAWPTNTRAQGASWHRTSLSEAVSN